MANLINLNAEEGANIIGDDATPTLTLTNTVGPALEVGTGGIVTSATATIATANVVTLKATTQRPSTAANATVLNFNFAGSSIASGAIFALINKSAFVSTTTIKVNTAVAANTGAIRVVKPDGTFGWIPVYADGDVTAVAV